MTPVTRSERDSERRPAVALEMLQTVFIRRNEIDPVSPESGEPPFGRQPDARGVLAVLIEHVPPCGFAELRRTLDPERAVGSDMGQNVRERRFRFGERVAFGHLPNVVLLKPLGGHRGECPIRAATTDVAVLERIPHVGHPLRHCHGGGVPPIQADRAQSGR